MSADAVSITQKVESAAKTAIIRTLTKHYPPATRIILPRDSRYDEELLHLVIERWLGVATIQGPAVWLKATRNGEPETFLVDLAHPAQLWTDTDPE